MSYSKLLCIQKHISICLNLLQKLENHAKLYDIVIMDEAMMTTLSLILLYLLLHLQKMLDILFKILHKVQMCILLAADIDALMLQTILPDIDWDNPFDLCIMINTSGMDGIHDHDIYMSNDLHVVC